MPGSTPILHLPYPSPPDPADVPADMQALAMAIDGLTLSPVLARGTQTTQVTTTGTSFAAGANVLATALSFSADGTSWYVAKISATGWGQQGNTTGISVVLALVLDGAQAATAGQISWTATNQNPWIPCAVRVAFQPAAGTHTVNFRLYCTAAGTANIIAGNGTAGANAPIFVSVERS